MLHEGAASRVIVDFVETIYEEQDFSLLEQW